MTRIVTCVLILLSSSSCRSQLVQTCRFEWEKKYSDDNFVMANSGDQGIMLFRETTNREFKGNAWEVIRLDTLLEVVWEVVIEVDFKYEIIGYEFSLGNLYLLFSEQYGGGKTKLHLVKIHGKDGSDEHYNLTSDLALQASHLLINDNQVVLGGEITYRSTFVIFDYKEDKVTVVPGFYNKKSEILDFNYDNDHKSYNVLLTEKGSSGHHLINMVSFDRNGDIVVDEKHIFEENIRALNGKVMIGNDNNLYYAGSYGINSSYYSQGIFFGKITPDEGLTIRSHRLNNFDHIFDYMGKKKAAKVKEKIKKSKSINKSYEFKTQMILQEFREVDEGFLLLSDIYKPEYHYMDKNPMTVRAGDNYSDGSNQKYIKKTSGITNTEDASSVNYYEAVLVQIDKNGKLLWDNSLPTPDIEMMALTQVAAAHVEGNTGCILYKDSNDIRYKLFSLESEEASDSTVAVMTFVEGDKIDKEIDKQGKIEKWYNNNFIIWGYQRVENLQSDEVDRRRNVFYINKLHIQ